MHQDRENISLAENLRVSGKLKEAYLTTRDYLINPNTIPDLNVPQLSDHIRAWRILTVSGLTLTRNQWPAKDAYQILFNLKGIIKNYYHHEFVSKNAQNILRDNEGSPYDHKGEMLRDEGKYNLVAYYVSGQKNFLADSKSCFKSAADTSLLDSCKGIAQIEYGQVLSLTKRGREDYPGETYEKYIHQGLETALTPVAHSKDRDRLEWLLTTVKQEAIKNSIKSRIAEEDILYLDNVSIMVLGKNKLEDLEQKIRKKSTALFLHRVVWSLTRFGQDFSKLDLNS